MINIPYDTYNFKPSGQLMRNLENILKHKPDRDHYLPLFEKQILNYCDAEHAIYCSNIAHAYQLILRVINYKTRPTAIETTTFCNRNHWYNLQQIQNIEYLDIDPHTYLTPPQPQNPLHAFNPHDTFGNIWVSDEYDPDRIIIDCSNSFGVNGVGARDGFEVCDLRGGVFGWDGAVILTVDDTWVKYLRQERDKYCRPSEYMSLVACEMLKYHPSKLKKRREVYERYRKELYMFIDFQQELYQSSYAVIAGTSNWSDRVIESNQGIEFKRLYKPNIGTENARLVYDNIICLPVDPDSVDSVIDAVKRSVNPDFYG